MFAFFETAERAAWRPEGPTPSIVLIMWGQSKLTDVPILAQGLLPGQILRVVANSSWAPQTLEALSRTQGLRIVHTTEDRVLTICGCYAHYYVDLQRVEESRIGSADVPAHA